MNNKTSIRNKLEEFNRIVGCYDDGIERLNKNNLKKVLEALEFGGDTDVTVSLNGKKYVIEIVTTSSDDEVDFYMSTLKEYNDKYGY